MMPLSERIKEFPAEQFVDWLCLACVDVREVRTPDAAQEEIDKIREAVTERLSALEQRAEAAEARLAESENQQPIEYRVVDMDGDVVARRDTLAEAQETVERWNKNHWRIKPVFDRPAPAVSLAELVPGSPTGHDCPEHILDPFSWMCGAGWFREAILRNIEEAK